MTVCIILNTDDQSICSTIKTNNFKDGTYIFDGEQFWDNGKIIDFKPTNETMWICYILNKRINTSRRIHNSGETIFNSIDNFYYIATSCCISGKWISLINKYM